MSIVSVLLKIFQLIKITDMTRSMHTSSLDTHEFQERYLKLWKPNGGGGIQGGILKRVRDRQQVPLYAFRCESMCQDTANNFLET